MIEINENHLRTTGTVSPAIKLILEDSNWPLNLSKYTTQQGTSYAPGDGSGAAANCVMSLHEFCSSVDCSCQGRKFVRCR